MGLISDITFRRTIINDDSVFYLFAGANETMIAAIEAKQFAYNFSRNVTEANDTVISWNEVIHEESILCEWPAVTSICVW